MDALAGMACLEELRLQAIRLHAVPAGLAAALPSLTSLDLSRQWAVGSLGGISNLVGLSCLARLTLSISNIRELPRGLPALTWLDLEDEQGRPRDPVLGGSLADLPRLRELRLGYVCRGSLPPGIQELTALSLIVATGPGSAVALGARDRAWLRRTFSTDGSDLRPSFCSNYLYRLLA